jgi:hypothetical protein
VIYNDPPQLNLYGLQSEKGSKVIPSAVRGGITFYPLADQQDALSRIDGELKTEGDFVGTQTGYGGHSGLSGLESGQHPFIPRRRYERRTPNRGSRLRARTLNWIDPKLAGGSQASIVRWQWDKQMGQPSGTWLVQVKENPGAANALDLDRDVFDGDWADVYLLRNGVKIPVCRGVVDSVREHTTSSGGATVRVWTITGRDHGAFFEYPITWQSIWVQSLGQLVSGLFTSRVKGKVGGSPDELFQILLEATFSEGSGRVTGQWELPPSISELEGQSKKRMWDLLDVIVLAGERGGAGLRGAYYNEPKLWTTGGQNLHQTISSWCNPLLNEWYYDLLLPANFTPFTNLAAHLVKTQLRLAGVSATDPSFANMLKGQLRQSAATAGPQAGQSKLTSKQPFGAIAAYIRERPFLSTVEGDSSMWFSLPTWKLPTWLEQEIDLGRGGHERYNLFELLADLPFGAQNEQPPQAKPVWNKADIAQRGLRTFSQSTPYLAASRGGPGNWYRERSDWQQLLVDWYGPSPYLRQGTVTYKLLLPDIRLGHKLIRNTGDPNASEQLYIEGVRCEWAWDSPPTAAPGGNTTFTLTHGFTGTDQQHLKAIEKHSDWWSETF